MGNSIVKVNLGKRSYDIVVGAGFLTEAGRLIAEMASARRAAVVTNDRVWELHGSKLLSALDDAGVKSFKISVPDSEGAKSLPVAEEVYSALIDARLERDEPVIAFGGGVVGDLAGFVAATYMRGVPLIHIPTTFLAQIDSSIGGKVAINHPKGKNLIGAFYQPLFVLADVEFLLTLDTANMRNGLAEAVKYGFIWPDGPLIFIENNLEAILAAKLPEIEKLTTECAAIKARVVEEDERDKGMRAILNYGHTFGHAIETSTRYGFSHGEAVAVGMCFAARLAARLGMIDKAVVKRHEELLERASLPVRAPKVEIASVLRAMAVDKKRQAGGNLFVLLEGVGHPVIRTVPEDIVVELAVEMIEGS